MPDDFFAAGLYQIQPVVPDREYSQDPNRPGPQRRDEVTGLKMWKLPVTDRAERNSKKASYDVILLSDEDPADPPFESGGGLRRIVLEGATVQPRVAGMGEYKSLAYLVRATGFRLVTRQGGSRSAGGTESGKTAS
ncbi:hypothetical protein ACFYTQ_26490 [Nocardia sp. NPDC004068]|uniref:hypothetical protein n=1 Tax=Nocardia sp. NPDC004068 TaxID=3364303 RepID=UPI0036C9B7F0